MQKITPHLWFDKEAKEAAEFYTGLFDDSEITNVTTLNNTPSGSVDIVSLKILNYDFQFISAGPLFKFTKSVSFHAVCNSAAEVDNLWDKLAVGGTVLMPIGSYPFSERYGWVQDKYGVSWQVIYRKDTKVTQRITPILMFVEDVCGKSEEAVSFYTSVFHNSRIDGIFKYTNGEEPDKAGTVKYASFALENQIFGAMDSARNHGFTFNEAISFIIHCDTQEEIDYYWAKLSAVPEAEQCGWLKDKYGVSWQVVPSDMDKYLTTGDAVKNAKVTEAFLKMKKFDLAELRRVAEE